MVHNVNEGNSKCKAKDKKVISLQWLYGIFDQDLKKNSQLVHMFSVCVQVAVLKLQQICLSFYKL